MDFRLIEIFCRVYEECSFSRAARGLGLTQPTVSIHIKELEESVGIVLFNRLGRDIEPTEAGRFLHARALPILELMREMAEQMAGFLNRVEGVLTIGASSVPGEYLLPGLVAGFHASHADVRVRLQISDTARTIEDVRHGRVELGVVGSAVADEDLAFEAFARDELVLAVPVGPKWPRRQELSMRQLRALPMLVREAGSATRMEVERALARRRLAPADFSIAAELGSVGAIKEAVRAGHGVSFVSLLTVEAEVLHGTLRIARLRELGRVRRSYYTVSSRRRVLAPATRAFVDYIRQHSEIKPRKRQPRR